jgi:hypothetical protein
MACLSKGRRMQYVVTTSQAAVAFPSATITLVVKLISGATLI